MGWDLGVCEIRNVSERHMGNCATYDVLLFSYFHFFFWFQTYGVMVKVENGSDPLRCFFSPPRGVRNTRSTLYCFFCLFPSKADARNLFGPG